MTTGAETGRMRPQAKGLLEPPEAGIFSPLEGARPYRNRACGLAAFRTVR